MRNSGPYGRIFFTLLLLTAAACAVFGSALPRDMPGRLRISYIWTSNRNLRGKYLYLSPRGGRFRTRYKGTETGFRFAIGHDELRRIYRIMRKHSFDRIPTRKRRIMDRGGISIQLSYAGHTHSKSHNASYGIRPGGHRAWLEVCRALELVITREVSTRQIPVMIKLVNPPTDKRITIELHGRQLFYWRGKHETNAAAIPGRLSFKALPGMQHLFVCVGNCSVYLRKDVAIKRGKRLQLRFGKKSIALE